MKPTFELVEDTIVSAPSGIFDDLFISSVDIVRIRKLNVLKTDDLQYQKKIIYCSDKIKLES